MPVQALIEPTATIAGGVVLGGQTYVVNHNQLSGNTAGKIAKATELLQERLDSRINVDDLPVDDPEHPDHADNAGLGYNAYFDPVGIAERMFYWQKNPSQVFLVHRNILVSIVLVMANDPSIGGEDRYALELRRLPSG
jgi:hypothetical protein